MGIGFGEAGHLEGLLRQRKAEGAVVANLRLLSLAAVIEGLLRDTTAHVDTDPVQRAPCRCRGGQLRCALRRRIELNGRCRGLLPIPHPARVIEVATNLVKIEFPRQELLNSLRAICTDLPCWASQTMPLVAGPAIITSLPDKKALLERYDHGRSIMDRTIVLAGFVLQDAPTV